MDDPTPWLIVVLAAVITFGMRVSGLVVVGRFSPDGKLVRWVGCVAYAMLAGLFARMILLPAGQLGQVPLYGRLGAVVLAVAVWRFAGRNVFLGSCAGVGAVVLIHLYL